MDENENEPEDLDNWCPECFGDEVMTLATGELYCCECKQVIDY